VVDAIDHLIVLKRFVPAGNVRNPMAAFGEFFSQRKPDFFYCSAHNRRHGHKSALYYRYSHNCSGVFIK
jgi:hypothetical protein